MIIKLEKVEVQSRKDMEMIDLTTDVDRVVAASGIREGIVLVLTSHTSSGVLITEGVECSSGTCWPTSSGWRRNSPGGDLRLLAHRYLTPTGAWVSTPAIISRAFSAAQLLLSRRERRRRPGQPPAGISSSMTVSRANRVHPGDRAVKRTEEAARRGNLRGGAGRARAVHIVFRRGRTAAPGGAFSLGARGRGA
jgi:hypothetical protein